MQSMIMIFHFLMKNMEIQMPESKTDQVPSLCARCGSTGTMTIITKTIGGVVRYYYKCSNCNYTYPV